MARRQGGALGIVNRVRMFSGTWCGAWELANGGHCGGTLIERNLQNHPLQKLAPTTIWDDPDCCSKGGAPPLLQQSGSSQIVVGASFCRG